MVHPLYGARKRIERADKHLHEVITEVQVFRQDQYDSIMLKYDGAALIVSAKDQAVFQLLPATISLAVSDCIHNFRSALDYLVYELARRDSGTIQKGTQFPICDSAAEFERQRPRYLKGLSESHVDAIEAYQPYKGINWTHILRDVSNPDKHRELIDANAEWSLDFTIVGGAPGSFKGRPGHVFEGIGADGCDVYVEREHAVSIAFSDGLPLIETLEGLKSQIALVIDSFGSEFKT